MGLLGGDPSAQLHPPCLGTGGCIWSGVAIVEGCQPFCRLWVGRCRPAVVAANDPAIDFCEAVVEVTLGVKLSHLSGMQPAARDSSAQSQRSATSEPTLLPLGAPRARQQLTVWLVVPDVGDLLIDGPQDKAPITESIELLLKTGQLLASFDAHTCIKLSWVDLVWSGLNKS